MAIYRNIIGFVKDVFDDFTKSNAWAFGKIPPHAIQQRRRVFLSWEFLSGFAAVNVKQSLERRKASQS